MVLYENLLFKGLRDSQQLNALFDSGATLSCIRPDLAEKLGIPQDLPDPILLQTAETENFMRVTQAIYLDFHLNDLRLFDTFLLVPNISEEIIIGASTMQKWRIKLDFELDRVITDPRVARLQLIILKFYL